MTPCFKQAGWNQQNNIAPESAKRKIRFDNLEMQGDIHINKYQIIK